MIETIAMFLLFGFAWAAGIVMIGVGIANIDGPTGWLLPAGMLVIVLAVSAVALGSER